VSVSKYIGIRNISSFEGLLKNALENCSRRGIPVKYRSRADIIAEILQAASHGATKTRLMYNAYLSYAQIKEYAAFLTEKGLLAQNERSNLYTLTKDGIAYLDAYRQIDALVALEDRRGKRYVADSIPVHAH
jgi:predicted transcriptional regulator